jgi:3'-5' exoribonuclease
LIEASQVGAVSLEATGTDPQILRLADLANGVEGTIFAVLVSRERKTSKKNEPFFRCEFSDRALRREAMIWSNSPWIDEAPTWELGQAFRIRARGVSNRYGQQIEIDSIRRATDLDDGPEGYRFSNLVEGGKYTSEQLWQEIWKLARRIEDRNLFALVERILQVHAESFERSPAAQNMHHAFIGGLIEHVWSVTRISKMLAEHYSLYYDNLNPPLNKDVVIAGAILHDIGKLRELTAHSIEARYTTVGQLIGHITMGRDLVRETANEVGGIDPETLMLLEHSILAHHGKREFGSPVEPQTVESLILSYADELDAKLNAVVRARTVAAQTRDVFTEKVYALDGRRFYNGVPKPPPSDDDPIDGELGSTAP